MILCSDTEFANQSTYRKNTDQFRNQCQTKKDLLDCAAIDPSDPFMGHLGTHLFFPKPDFEASAKEYVFQGQGHWAITAKFLSAYL